MNFSYNWLQSFFKRKLPKPEKLAELLNRYSFEVEELKKADKDWILDIDVLPNRGPDCFSHIGIAREIAAILNLKLQIPDTKLTEDKDLKAKDFIKLEVRGRGNCLRYTARVITGLEIFSSPKWLQERLITCGLRPINNVVDIANFVMLETGQPLHAFDFNKIEEKKIIVREAKAGEKITTLDNEKYDLDDNILIIADPEGPLAIAGIKGGKKAEIDKKTKTVVLESANFNQKVIRRSSKKIDLKTDASWRFEHGIDPNLTGLAINRATFLIQKIAGGKVTQGLIDFFPQKFFPKKIKLNLDYIENLLGMKIPEIEIKNILKRLDFKISKIKNNSVMVIAPTQRLDISTPEDLIEEIGRIYGYQKIPAVFPLASLVPPKRNLDIFWEDMVKDILKEVGFSEVYNYSFIGEKTAQIFNYSPELVEIENPISSDFKYLRPSLIPNLVKDIQLNQKNFKNIKIFELGKVFQNFKEKRMLTGVMTGNAFYQIKGIINLLFNKLGISNVWYDEYKPTPEESKLSIWHSKKCAEIKIDREEVGFMGEISSKIIDDLKLSVNPTQEQKVVAFDLDFEKLIKLASEENEYQPISRYPAAVRDLAVLVPMNVLVEEVLKEIYNSGGKLIRDVDLFDIYEGEEIPDGEKNLAFHIIYQAEDRTLSTKDIDEIQNKIIKSLEDKNWEVRK